MATKTKDVSVIIPFYNRSNVFLESLESVENQSTPVHEIIVVDDGSNEEEKAFLKQHEHRFKLITLPVNNGVSNARNVGVKEAAGDYIAFLDSDDTWDTQKTEKQLHHFENSPDCSVVHTGCRVFYPDGKEVFYNDKPLRLEVKHLIKNSHLTPPSMMIKRSVFNVVGGFDTSFRQTEDYELSFRLVTKKFNIDFIPEPLTNVRQGTSDKISKNWKGFLFGHWRVVKKYKPYYVKEIGMFGYYYVLLNYLEKSGYKQARLIGKLYILMARVAKAFIRRPDILS